jgi:hypothetical protein
MMLLLILLVLGVFLFWPKIKNMMSGTTSSTQLPVSQVSNPVPAYSSSSSATTDMAVKTAQVGPLANLLGNTVGNLVSGVVSIPRNAIGSIFNRKK